MKDEERLWRDIVAKPSSIFHFSSFIFSLD